MDKSTGDITKKKRPPAAGEPILVRMQPDLVASLDIAIRTKLPYLSRPEAVRSILLDWFITNGIRSER